MEYVVDASVVVKWFIPEHHSDKAEKLLADFRNKQLELSAPDHLVVEVANALWHRSTLRHEITVAEAAGSYADLMTLGLKLYSAPPLVGAALALAAQVSHSVYDILYIQLASQRGCEFITADKRLVNKLAQRFPFVRWLGDF